jgi:hypothetical protein
MALSIAKTTSTDIAMAGTAILSAVSYCLSGVYRMQGKQDHTEPLTLYSLILAEPSELKSPVIHFVREPFHDFENQWNESHKTEIFTLQEQRKSLEKEIEVMHKEDENPQEVAKKLAELDDMPMSDFRRIAVDDITPESLVRLLNVNQTLLMISDEAGMFGNFGGRYSNGIPNVDLLLKCWNGERYISDRAITGTMKIDRPYLSICLAGQPYILENLMANPAFLMSGLVARFVYCFPKTNIGKRKYETEPNPEKVHDLYSKLIQIMLEKKFSKTETSEKFLRFDEEARKNFTLYFDSCIEPMQTTEFGECRDWGGKYHGLILRICGILHCVNCIAKGLTPENEKVTIDSLCHAIDLADYYKEQAIYAYGLREIDNDIVKAEHILKKIKAKFIKEIRQNDLYKLCRCKMFKNADDFCNVIAMLEEYGYLRRETSTGTNNKTITDIVVNPDIFR